MMNNKLSAHLMDSLTRCLELRLPTEFSFSGVKLDFRHILGVGPALKLGSSPVMNEEEQAPLLIGSID
jgi:hypothetical protein